MLHTEDYLIQMALASITSKMVKVSNHPLCLYREAKKAYWEDQNEQTYCHMVQMANKAMNLRITMRFLIPIIKEMKEFNLKYQDGEFVHV